MWVRTLRSALQAIGFLGLVVPLAGCLVRESRYQHALQQADLAHDEARRAHEETQQARKETQQAREETQRAREEISSVRSELVSTQSLVQARETKANLLAATMQNLQARLDDSTALQQQLTKILARMGKNPGVVLQDRGAAQQALEDAKSRLAELRTLQAAAEARNDAMAFFAGQLGASQETQPITVKTRDGDTALLIPEALLFEPGHAELKRSAERVLYILARVLLSSPDWRFRIVGYTPVVGGKPRTKAVFDLAALRACYLANRLVTLGLAPSSLSVASRIDATPVQPAAAPDPAAGGRIEIELAAVVTQAIPATGVSAGPAKKQSRERGR